ncbi:MAG: hypothetical protein NTV80_11445 [Verrucomicrobia bacterium]|nr:hypothetical protein [Verrucomicrobiota bacterium]
MNAFIAPDILTPNGIDRLPIRFGVASDIGDLRLWRAGRGHPLLLAARDSIEYAKLASKRWRYYAQRGESAKSLSDIESMTHGDNQNEIGFLLVAESVWKNTPPTLAIAWCRRTWCHHLVLDFLACHPFAFDPRSGFSGIGSAMLVALGLVTERLDIDLIWGEATAASAGFYSKRVLRGQPVKDHFFIQGKNLATLKQDGKIFAV